MIPKSVSVLMSSVGLQQPELRAKTDSTSQDGSNDTNNFADLTQEADRVRTFRCFRRTQLMIMNRKTDSPCRDDPSDTNSFADRSRPISDLCMQQADAPDVCES
eukprot:9471366-Pyramimonas_sp.AAC.1